VFRREGFGRDARLNTLIAGYLAFVAGVVNSGGFVLLGTFTSHVTGNVNRVGYDLAHGDVRGALLALSLVVSFFLGSFGASLVIEGTAKRTPIAYGIALLLQGLLLASFAWTEGVIDSPAHALAARAAILCAAMGMQNSLVTRLSGAVVRTTHLTGIMTDLGIEAARWYRWLRHRMAVPALLPGRARPTKPSKQHALLLSTITLAFFVGVSVGAALTLYTQRWAMVLPALATLALSAYAFSQRDAPDEPRAHRADRE
jgi:uncharacterized membrane protein YoaK (UPF0700 family)